MYHVDNGGILSVRYLGAPYHLCNFRVELKLIKNMKSIEKKCNNAIKSHLVSGCY